MNLTVAVETPFIEVEDVVAGDRLMSPQHVNMTLLAQLRAPCPQQLHLV